MQRSIFSNTVYKNRTSLVGIRVSPPPAADPSVKQRPGQLYFFKGSNLFSPSSWYTKLLRAGSIIAHVMERKERRKKQLLPVNSATGFYYRFSCFPKYPNGSSLMQFRSTFCLTDVRDVQFKQDVSRRDSEAWKEKKKKKLGSIYIILGLKLKTARVRDETERERDCRGMK